MIPEEVEYRIAAYFLQRYLPEDIMIQVEEVLLLSCVSAETEEELDYDALVWMAVEIINELLNCGFSCNIFHFAQKEDRILYLAIR